MIVPFWIRKARCNPRFIKFAKTLGLNTYLKKMYNRFTLLGDKKIKIGLFGYSAHFYINSVGELAMIEISLIDPRQGEIRVLEKLIQMLNPGDTVYDIGASIGTHAIFMAMKVGEKGKIIAFEPEVNSYKKLNANIKLNSLRNIMSMNVALGRHSGKKDIYGGSEDSFGLFSIIRHKDDRYIEEVKMSAGDNFVRDRHLPLPDIVKIDVEGYEYYVLQGLKNTLMQEKCRLVFCEIHTNELPEQVTSEDIISLLKFYGFNKVEAFARGKEIHTFCYKTNY